MNTVFMQMLLQSLCERELSQYIGYKTRMFGQLSAYNHFNFHFIYLIHMAKYKKFLSKSILKDKFSGL
ncbi:hypothetical protein GARC_2668 [Paraglaciecola arctica BSs20135]|uniref:Uncharacterized protein n=1 Tax=Paraglaciecola arctica BSs20135 TaxID=493475 RepID=K6XG47_9ALTE|nr:hypothetical protein GARC_2668 [Paraglaciecola arctica BSs20135]